MSPDPIFLIVAGPNGSGKTTLCENPRFLNQIGKLFDTGHFLNPDKIALTERSLNPHLSIQQGDLIAAERVEEAVSKYIAGRISFLVETVLSSDKYKKFWTMAGTSGFERHLIYVGLESFEISAERVTIRSSQGGHDVPLNRLKNRFDRSLENLAWFAKEADNHFLLNGSNDYHMDALGTKKQVVIKDRSLPWIDKVFCEFSKGEEIKKDPRYNMLGFC